MPNWTEKVGRTLAQQRPRRRFTTSTNLTAVFPPTAKMRDCQASGLFLCLDELDTRLLLGFYCIGFSLATLDGNKWGLGKSVGSVGSGYGGALMFCCVGLVNMGDFWGPGLGERDRGWMANPWPWNKKAKVLC